MVRQKLQDLSAPTVSTPLTSPVDTFAPSGSGVLGRASVAPELLDLSSISNAAGQLYKRQRDLDRQGSVSIGTKAGLLEEAGKTDEEIITELANSKDTPRRLAVKFRKMAESGDIDEVDSPYFLLGLGRVRGRFVANQAASVAAELEDRYAARLALLPVGDEEQRKQVISEALSEVREGIKESLGSLGPAGARAAEEHLVNVGNQLVANLDGKARSARLDEYKDKVGVELKKLATVWQQSDADTDLRQYSIDGVGALYSRLKLEGKVDAEDFLEKTLVTASGSIQQAEGWEAASEFLEDVYLNAKELSGAKIFATRPSPQLLEGLRIAEFRAKQETDEKPQKIATQRKEAFEAMQGSELYEAMSQAANISPDAVRQAAANIRDIIERKDAEGLEKLGLTEDTAVYGATFINQLELDTLRTSRELQANDTEAVTNSVLATYLEVGPSEALEALRGSGLPAGEQLKLHDRIQEMVTGGSQRQWSNLMQTGIMSSIGPTVAASFPADSPDFLVQAAIRRAKDEVAQRFMEGGYNTDNPLTGPQAIQWANEFLGQYSPAEEASQGATLEEGEDPLQAARRFSKTQGTLEEAGSVLKGASTRIVGGFTRGNAPAVVEALEEKTFNPAYTVRDRSMGNAVDFSSTLRALVEDPEIPETAKPSAILESLMRVGGVPLYAFAGNLDSSADPEEHFRSKVLETLAIQRPQEGEVGLLAQVRSRNADLNEETLNMALDLVNLPDLSRINPFLVRFPEFEKDLGYLVPDPSNPDAIRWNPNVEIDGTLIETVEAYLQMAGISSDQDTLKEFIEAQNALWGR